MKQIAFVVTDEEAEDLSRNEQNPESKTWIVVDSLVEAVEIETRIAMIEDL